MPVGMKAFGLEFSNAALGKRPEHAAAIGRLMGLWSLIEAAVASILGHLMHDNPRAAIALMDSFTSNQARLAAVKKVARELLEDDEFSKFGDLMDRVQIEAQTRNKIAHGVWGVDDEETSSVFLLPLKDYARLPVGYVTEAKHGNPLELVQRLLAKADQYSLDRLKEIESIHSKLLEDLVTDLSGRMLSQRVSLARHDASGAA